MPDYPVHVSCIDAYNGIFTKRFEVDAIDYATALTDAAAMITDFETLCAGAVLFYTVATKVLEGETPEALSNRDEGFTWQMDLDNGKRATLKLPAPVKTAAQADRSIDLTNAAVVNFLAHWIDGPFLISDGETAVGVIKGVLDK